MRPWINNVLLQVNLSTTPFSFSAPELYQIQDYCRDTLGLCILVYLIVVYTDILIDSITIIDAGWTEDEIRAKILPVIQSWLPFLSGDGNRGELTQQQRRIDSFYHTYHDNTRVAKICSTRLRNAVQKNKSKSIPSVVEQANKIG